MSKRTVRLPGRLPSSFEALVRLYPPRALRDDRDHDNVQELLDRLTSLPRLTKGQAEYLETLTVLFDAYQKERFAIATEDLEATDVLDYLLERHGMSASDLGRLLGDRALGSRILRGERRLSKKHIHILCERFSVSADLFL